MTPDHLAILPFDRVARRATAHPRPQDQDGPGAGAFEAHPDPADEPFESGPGASPIPNDYPPPRALRDRTTFDWNDDSPRVENFAGLGRRLAGGIVASGRDGG